MATSDHLKIENDPRSFSRTVGDNRRLAVISEVHCTVFLMTKEKQLREHSDNAELKLNIKIKNARDNFCTDLINIVSLINTCDV